MDDLSSKFNELRGTMMSVLNMQRTLLFSQSAQQIRDLLDTERGSDPLRILKYGQKVFSQNDEDGIINEIFRRIGTDSRKFLEFGVEKGVECNTLMLLQRGWTGAWFEGNPDFAKAISKTHKDFMSSSLKVVETFVTAENIEGLIEGNDLLDIDLLSIDIDGNDYWVWKAIGNVKPRLVIVEYSAIMPADVEWIAEYEAMRAYDGTNYHGASLKSYQKLAESKGYFLVGCNLNGCNAFFVRGDLLQNEDGSNRFLQPYSAENHYEPFRFPYLKFVTGKRPSPKRGTTDVSHEP